MANFLQAAGYLSPAPLTGTCNTHTTTTVDTISGFTANTQGGPLGTGILKGQFLTLGGGGHQPDYVATITSGTAITILTATTSTLTGTAINVYNYPVLIGGEATALADGAALTSSYWNNTGVFLQSHLNLASRAEVWFFAGAAFTPAAGNGGLNLWFLESHDATAAVPGGTNYDAAPATASTTVPALRRPPDINIPLDNAAFAAGNTAMMAGRYVRDLPTVPFKVRMQNNSGAAMVLPWGIFLAPVADAL